MFFNLINMNDDMQDTTSEEVSDEGYQFEDASNEPAVNQNDHGHGESHGGDRRYANEVFSESIHAKFRTFYIDLKESHNGKFVKISEKSRGRKSTIMMDAEDVPEMIKVLQKVQEKL